MLEPLDINGQQPTLVGVPCDELVVQQSWYLGELVTPACVIYLRFAGEWSRLYFDCGIVFWRLHDRAPEDGPPTEEGYAWPLVDLGRQLGIQGVVLDRLEAASIEGGSEVRFGFRDGSSAVFRDVADRTTYHTEAVVRLKA